MNKVNRALTASNCLIQHMCELHFIIDETTYLMIPAKCFIVLGKRIIVDMHWNIWSRLVQVFMNVLLCASYAREEGEGRWGGGGGKRMKEDKFQWVLTLSIVFLSAN